MAKKKYSREPGLWKGPKQQLLAYRTHRNRWRVGKVSTDPVFLDMADVHLRAGFVPADDVALRAAWRM